jgi:hypothetical protein
MKEDLLGETRLFREAQWWRSDVSVKQDRLVSAGPLQAYNAFDFYIPSRAQKAEAKKSLHYHFANIDAEDQAEVAQFCSRYGFIGGRELAWLNDKSQAMKAVLPHVLESADMEFAVAFSTPASGKVVTSKKTAPYYPNELSLTLFRQRQAVFKKAISAIQKFRKPEQLVSRSFGAHPVANMFSINLSLVRPVIRWDSQAVNWSIAWEAASLESILWLMLFLDTIGPGIIRSCPKCGSPFLATREATRFCSAGCQNNYKALKYYHLRKRLSPRVKDT